MNRYDFSPIRKAVEWTNRHPKVWTYDILTSVNLETLSPSVWQPKLQKEYKIKLVWVDPNKIKYKSRFPFVSSCGEYTHIGVAGGCWDRFKLEFKSDYVYRSINKRFDRDARWEETPAYKVAMKAVQKDEARWQNSSTVKEVKYMCESVDRLYNVIKNEGYKKQSELRKENRSYMQLHGLTVPQEITIAVGRNGELIRVNEGRHRLAVAKVLDLDRIPALVQMEHVESDRTFKIDKEFKININNI